MEAVSQVILRNLGRMPAGPVWLVDPARDLLPRRLGPEDRAIRISSSDFGDFAWFRDGGADVSFETVPALGQGAGFVIAVLPREKDRLEMLLHSIASALSQGGVLWLVGAIQAGIKSSPRHLRQWFGEVEKLDSARHCQLIEARSPLRNTPFSLELYERRWQAPCGPGLPIASLPGVFAHGRLDAGTARLLPLLESLSPAGRILDFACGSGVIGSCLLRLSPGAELTLLDNSAPALESTRRTLALNGQVARLLPSDGLAELDGRFDWIVSNPPFHKGVANTLDVAEQFFQRAGTFLAGNGKILVVFNRHLPYLGWMRERFKHVDLLDDASAYRVVRAFGPR